MTIKQLGIAKEIRPYTGKEGFYCSLQPTFYSSEKFSEWTLDFKSELLPARLSEDFHCTVMYSKVVPNTIAGRDPKAMYTAKLDHFEYWDGHDNDGYLVAVMRSPSIVKLNKQWSDRGAVHSFPDFTPHCSLADKFTPTKELLARIKQMSQEFKGSLLSFTGESLESIKP